MPTFYVLLHADDDKELYWDEPVTQAQFEAASWEKIIDVPNTGAIGYGYGYTGPLTYYPLELNHEGGVLPREGDSEGYAIRDPIKWGDAEWRQLAIRYELDGDGVVRPHYRLNLLDGAILAYENALEVVNVPDGGLHNGLYYWSGNEGAGIEIYEASAYRIYLPKKSPSAPPAFWTGFRQCKEVLK